MANIELSFKLNVSAAEARSSCLKALMDMSWPITMQTDQFISAKGRQSLMYNPTEIQIHIYETSDNVSELSFKGHILGWGLNTSHLQTRMNALESNIKTAAQRIPRKPKSENKPAQPLVPCSILICPICKVSTENIGKFCSNCGTELIPVVIQPPQTNPNNSTPETSQAIVPEVLPIDNPVQHSSTGKSPVESMSNKNAGALVVGIIIVIIIIIASVSQGSNEKSKSGSSSNKTKPTEISTSQNNPITIENMYALSPTGFIHQNIANNSGENFQSVIINGIAYDYAGGQWAIMASGIQISANSRGSLTGSNYLPATIKTIQWRWLELRTNDGKKVHIKL